MKKYLHDGIAILIFIFISFLYFIPSVIDGRVLIDHDASAGIGAGQEAKEYYEKTGERTRWTNSLFGGMPTYQISPSYNSTDTLKIVEKTYSLFLPQYVSLLFIMMIGFYILLRAFNLSPGISCLGGIIWTFSSYFFILIAAGHLWKFITLAYIPPTIAGIVLVYRKNYLWGAAIATLFASLQIISNHIQMTYYFLFVILFLVIAFFIESYKEKQLTHFFKATGILIIAALIAIAINSSSLYHTYQYSKESTRGKSELTTNTHTNTDKGVDKAYITQWSYGIDETLTLLIPNFKGRASKPMSRNESAMEKSNPQFYNVYNQVSQYFGDQPFTAGPVYVGAFVLFLFFIGCFTVKGPIKWALISATIFSIILSWGKNFMPITEFFIDYIPLYNKFRAVSSILVIAEFTIPLLGILGLVNLINNKESILEYKKPLIISFILTGGLALIIALFPNFLNGSFVSNNELIALSQAPANFATQFISSLELMRADMVKSDAWRSVIIISVGCFILYLYFSDKANKPSTIAMIIALCLFDLWSINKRYLNDDLFVPKTDIGKTFKATAADKYILNKKDLNSRVLNFTTNTFNENITSYWHNSIGGYNAAKLRRYQELIDHYIQNEMNTIINKISNQDKIELLENTDTPVLNMLNTKYYIFGSSEKAVMENEFSKGNAWFVSKIEEVNSANEEINKLGEIDINTTAIINTTTLNKTLKGGVGEIELISYQPNELVYNVNTQKEGLALFSEIYYPGWQAYINDQPIDILRANYVLRAINMPQGEYQLKMIFMPNSLRTTEIIAYIALIILLSSFLFMVYKEFKK